MSATLQQYLLGIQHVGHVVSDLDEAVANFSRVYGSDPEGVRWEPPAGVSSPSRFAFVRVGDTEFELIEATDPQLREVIERYPSGLGGLNHIAWRVSDMTAAMALLADQGIVPGHVTPDGPVSFGNKKLVYLDPSTTGGLLLELIEISE
ncbi:VOC family protein [Spongiibacter sp.]|uniref:VOC family protein n=1 Tax=Spongiibacter sp. TaxID=2024860 RepID=UPI0035663E83